MQPGNYETLKIVRLADFGVYLSDGESDVLLPNKYVPKDAAVGDEVRVFLYTDSEDRIVATTRQPAGTAGDVVKLACIEANKLGAFLDWGLEKDLFVPFRNQLEPMRKGREYIVAILFDKRSGRLVGSNRFDRMFKNNVPDTLSPGDPVRILPYWKTDLGIAAIVAGKYLGMLYSSETFEPVELGVKRNAFVVKVREDGRLDLSLRRPGREGVLDCRAKVLAALEKGGGVLHLGIKTPPRSIERALGMSKRTFKEIVGNLYKERLITVEPEYIRSTASGSAAPK